MDGWHRPGRNGRPGFLSAELHRAENGHILFCLRAAILRGHRPTFLLFGTQPDSKWNDDDRLMFMAYQKYDDETVKSHGQPLWLARTFDANVAFSVDVQDDLAQKALDEFDKKRNDSKTPKLGEARFVVPVMLDETPVPIGGLMREQYFREYGLYMSQLENTEPNGLTERMPPGGYDPSEYGDGSIDSP